MPRTRARTGKPTAKPELKRPTKKTAPRKALPVRKHPYMTDIQGHATLAARIAGITTPHIQQWIDHHDGTTTRALQDGTLHYDMATRTLTWQATCRMGATHTYAIPNPGLAHLARILATRCTQIHHDLAHVEALTADEYAEYAAWATDDDQADPDTADAGIRPAPCWAAPHIPGEEPVTASIPVPLPDRRARALGDTLTHATTAAADTQPLSKDDITAGLAARAADAETPKEHPQP